MKKNLLLAMKNLVFLFCKLRKLLLLVIVLVGLFLCMYFITGSKTNNTVKNNSKSKVVTESAISIQEDDEFSDIDYEDIPDIANLSQEEYDKLSLQEIKAIVYLYVSDYKKVYKINENHEMTNEDWGRIRLIMRFQLYGTTKSTLKNDTGNHIHTDDCKH